MANLLKSLGICAFFVAGFLGNGCKAKPTESATEATAAQLNIPKGLVISQVYGGAGSERAVFNRDFVELFNRSNEPISLAGLSIHYAGPIGEFNPAGNLPDVVVPPGGYFLVGFGAGLWGTDLRPDGAGLPYANILPVNGKIALVKNVAVNDPATADAAAQLLGCGSTDAGTCGTNERVIDFVGYGLVSDHEGTAAAAAPSAATAVRRKNNGCADTGNNAADFERVTPTPRTAVSPRSVCGAQP